MADSLRHDLRLVMTDERPCVQRVEHSQMDERSERIAKRFEVPLLIAAVLVIPVIIVEESRVGEPWDTAAFVLNYAIWTVLSTLHRNAAFRVSAGVLKLSVSRGLVFSLVAISSSWA